ncbi:PD-(D/E)XK nuclease family protein [bacterium]|nr:PD-(D/E)XK nuclease family protein [bacterium]
MAMLALEEPRRLPLLRTSGLKTWMTCPRRYRFEHVQGVIKVEEAHALRFGTLWHLLMEGYLGAVQYGTDPLEALHRLDSENVDPWDLAKLRPLFLGYVARWWDEDRAGLNVLSIEREYEHDLINPDTGHPSRTYRFGGRLDAEVSIGGRLLVMEHKTSSDDIAPGSDYWRQKRIDAQASNYLAATGAEGNLYDVVKKPTIRPLKATPVESRKYTKDGRLYAAQRELDETTEEYEIRWGAQIAESPDTYYQRGEVVRTADELAEAQRDRWELGKQIAEGVRLNRFPRNTSACFPLAGAPCPFASVCAGEASIDSPLFTKKEGF